MKSYLLFVLLFVLGLCSNARAQAIISGRLLEQATGQPLPFATITLNSETDGAMITGAITDEEGRFTISGIEKGNYEVRCSYMGYKTKIIPILIGEKNEIFDLGRIEITAQAEQLSEVIVEAKTALVASGLDKKSFSIDDNFAQSGGSVLDAMKGLPGISVDQEGKVWLRGSDKVAVLIDGKQSSLTGFSNQKGLDNIPAANIERIEIINNPSAKYDAMGMAGIINIIYKKEKESGFNGDIGMTMAVGELTTRKEDLPTELGRYSVNPKYIPSLNLNYRTPALHTFLQAEVLQQRRLPNNEFHTRTYQDGARIISQVPENRTQTQYIIKGGLDWAVDERNFLGFSAIYDRENHVDTSQVPYIDLNTGERLRYWHWREEEVTGYMNYRGTYKHLFPQTGHQLTAALQYTRGWEDETYFLNDSSSIRQGRDTTHILAIEHTSNLTVDYVKPMPSGRLEAGVKFQVRKIPVTYTVGRGENSIIYPGLGEWSDWGENIYAGYINYLLEKKKFDIEAGLRLEQTDVFYDLDPENIYYDQNDSYDYFRVYPSVRVSLKINERHGFSAFYNRRVDRPGEPELRVFPKFDDPELLKVGNPYLRPQFTQTLELTYKYNWNEGSVYLSVYHRMIDAHFLRIFSIDETNADHNIINKIYQNVGNATNSGVEFIVSTDIGDFWDLTGSINWYINTIESFEGQVLFPYVRPFRIERTEDNTFGLKLNNQFQLPGKTQVQLTFIYDAPKNIPQGRQLSRASVDLGFKKSVLAEKGEVIFAFSDLFNTFGIRQEIEGEGFSLLYENYYETQIVSLGLKYKF